jgi:hypothetical protein
MHTSTASKQPPEREPIDRDYRRTSWLSLRSVFGVIAVFFAMVLALIRLYETPSIYTSDIAASEGGLRRVDSQNR